MQPALNLLTGCQCNVSETSTANSTTLWHRRNCAWKTLEERWYV